MRKHYRWAFATSTLLAATPGLAMASVIGFLGNFDVINDTGHTAHGFEIELEGLHPEDITDTFGGAGRGFPSGRGFDPSVAVQRYGAPTIAAYSQGSLFGVTVTYRGLFDGTQWDFGTPSGSFVTPGDNCWTGGGLGGSGYGADTPCDHFGVGTAGNATKTTYRWLLETATPGELTNGVVALPAPVWSVLPNPVPNPDPLQPAPPIVVAQIVAPAPEDGNEFGDALWVKVYTTELEVEVELEDLVGGNPAVEQAETEIEWQLLQVEFSKPGSGQLESGLGVPVGPKAASILRRYEFFSYAGAYGDGHEADPTGNDSNPGEGDVGIYLGAQNGAVNLLGAAAPVPVPPALAMMLPALGALWLRRRRR